MMALFSEIFLEIMSFFSRGQKGQKIYINASGVQDQLASILKIQIPCYCYVLLVRSVLSCLTNYPQGGR